VRYNEDLGCRVNLSQLKRVAKKDSRYCMYSKDNYTDEDRKVLCGDCEEECEFNKKEEPVSEELEKASKEWLIPQLDKSYANYGETKMMELTHFDGYAMLDAIEFGAQWQKEQMMKGAVDGWVFRDIKEGKLRISDNKECWNGIRIPEKSIEKSYLFCTTDDAIKVKLVIIKED